MFIREGTNPTVVKFISFVVLLNPPRRMFSVELKRQSRLSLASP